MTKTLTPTAGPAMRFHVDGWDPTYGTSMAQDEALDGSTARIEVAVEVPAEHWAPVDPARDLEAPSAVLFVDGIRRLDARVWVEEPPAGAGPVTDASLALASSYAAGVVCCCPGRAHLVDHQIRRGLFTTTTSATDLVTRFGTYPVRLTAADPAVPLPVTVAVAVQADLGSLELTAATNARQQLTDHGLTPGTDLLVVDGPLRTRAPMGRTIGFVKSHRTTYLPPELNGLVAALSAGQRTPVFLIGTNWDRYTWYLRLPCPPGAPWTGIVRLEACVDQPLADVLTLANLSQTTLPRFASTEYKDSRAPQNLYPIAGLERELRRRLGDQALLDRALRLAARA